MPKNICFLKLFLIFLSSNIKCVYNYEEQRNSRDDLLVNANAGPIRGIRASDGNYTMYMGIPFAKVDEKNPFGPSTPHPKFEVPFDAYYDSAICPQIEEFNNTITGTIDCLQLNVYVPDSASPSNPLPVLVWIHGGAYSIGFANRYLYGPSYLVEHDVILVTINYRLGPYGFMCLDTPEVPGNQGLKDQLLGLRWIKDNIEFFNGDKNKITVFGQSVGAISIHLHLLSEQEDLFNQVIMHSGSAFITETVQDVDKTTPIRIAEKLGYITSDMNEALTFISSATTDSVIRAASEVELEFWPCIESDHDGQEKFLTEYPINLKIPKIKGKSVLLGYTSEEMIMLYANLAPENFRHIDLINSYVKIDFNFKEEQRTRIQNIVRNFYLGGKELSREMMQEIVNFHSDYQFAYPVERCIDPFIENGAEKLYYFVFSYIGKRNFVRILSNTTIGGAAHTDELGYLFDMQFLPEEPTPVDQLTIERMTKMWTNFVKYGDPTPETSTLLPVKWQPITKGSPRHYMDINSELSVDSNHAHERMSFWDLFFEAFGKYQIGYKDGYRNYASSVRFSVIILLVPVVLLFSLLCDLV